MKTAPEAPQTLAEAIRHFADPDVALAFMVKLRWPAGVACPHCGDMAVSFLKTRRIWKCKGCHQQFSVKVGTIFEESALGLDKWIPAVWLLANCKNGISSYEVARALHVTQKTAWFMMHRIRFAMQTKRIRKFSGAVEVDETFVGGKAKFMHKADRKRRIHGTGGMDKTAVMGIVERKRGAKLSQVSATVLPNLSQTRIQAEIQEAVARGSSLYTDTAWSYGKKRQFRAAFKHAMVNHAREYVRGKVHTNTVENFWSLLKRAIKGTYVSVDPFHLIRYVDEQAFRFNQRGGTDGSRFADVVKGITGKRLTYADLTGAKFDFATT